MAPKRLVGPKKQNRNLIEGAPINAPMSIALRYRMEMKALIEACTSEAISAVDKLFETETFEEIVMDDSPSSQARILTNELIRRFMKRFNNKAYKISDRFVRRSDKANETSVRASIKRMAKDVALPKAKFTPEMQDILKASIVENTSLIKSIGQEHSSKVQQAVMRAVAQGTDITQLRRDIKRIGNVSEKRAKIIAFDQTHKISNDLSEARFISSGLTKYVWRHTPGSNEPRPLHVEYNGQVFKYGKPILVQRAEGTGKKKRPAVYGKPGTLINCSCRMQPVIEF